MVAAGDGTADYNIALGRIAVAQYVYRSQQGHKQGGALLLAKAANPQQQALIGKQGGGRVWLFLHTDDIDADIAHMQRHDVHFTESPRDETYGRVVVFVDLWGNRWDLIEPRR